MIRVCHIISGDLWAGAEVMDFHLLKKLKQFGNLELSAILLNEGRLANEIRCLGIPVDVVDETQRSFFQIIRDTGKILIRRSPDVVHSHRYKENILAFLSSKYKSGIRLVCTQHGMPEFIGTNHKIQYLFLQKINFSLLSKSFRKVVAVSNDMKEVFINRFGFHENKITVILNGTDIPISPPLKCERDYIIIGSMGRFFPVKDFSLMVEIAKEVCKETDKIRFELAGDGPEREKIRDLIQRYRLENIFLLRGTVENLFEFYQNIDLYLNTSLHEGIPMSILEAMSFGIPIIAPNTGGIKEIINDGVEGYLENGRDPKVFANKCLHLYKDRALRRCMGSSAMAKVEKKFSNERMAREYYQLYLDVVNV